MLKRIEKIMDEWVGEQVPDIYATQAFQLSVYHRNTRHHFCAGKESASGKACTISSVFDLASVTKPFVATLALIAVDRAMISFDSRIRDYFPTFKSDATLLNLLNHSSGLPAWDKFYERMELMPSPEKAGEQRSKILEEILKKDLKISKVESIYSDLGYILLGRWVEMLFDQELDIIVKKEITEKLQLSSLQFVNWAKGDPPLDCVRSEYNEKRGGDVVGVVHDENCYIQGGVEGHAGLFSTSSDLLEFGDHFRRILGGGFSGIVNEDTIRFAISDKASCKRGHYRGGWDTPSGAQSSVGRYFSKSHTFGHLGFSGTSLWIDLAQQISVAMLTNRVYPTRENPKIKAFRIAIHESISSQETK